MHLLVLVGASVVVEAKAALFDMPFTVIQWPQEPQVAKFRKKKSFVVAMLARLRDGNKRFLNLIEGFLRNHGLVHAVVHFALVQKNAIVEVAAEQVADGRKW